MSEEDQAPDVGATPNPQDPEPRHSRGPLVHLLAIVAVALAVTGYLLLTNDDDIVVGDGPAPAGCDEVITKPTDENQQHLAPPTPITYADAPPAFGEHRPDFVPFGRPFYAEDRPEVGNLVHTLEHGYTIAWYDQDAAEDDATVAALRELAEDYQANRERFIAAPWFDSDGDTFPGDRNIALVRWSADAAEPQDKTKQRGNWMYCTGVDQDAIKAFFDTWPNAQSPEPGLQ